MGGFSRRREHTGKCRESPACSSVARGPTPPEVLEALQVAITALEAGEVEVARARLLVLAAV